MKGVVIYKGKYGATMQYAEWIAAMLDLKVFKAGEVPEAEYAQADYFIIGTSVYIGELQISKWLRQHITELTGKKIIVFIVAGTPPDQVSKLDAYYMKGVPKELRDHAECYYLPGKLVFGELSVMDKILLKMGHFLAQRRGETIKIDDYNEVKKTHILPIIREVRAFSETLAQRT